MKEINNKSRRNLLTKLAGLPFASSLLSMAEFESFVPSQTEDLPAKNLFDIKGTYINAAYFHPMSNGSYKAIHSYLNERKVNGHIPSYDMDENRRTSKNLFAKLINAEAEEIAWVPSTMAGENCILNGLSIPGTNSRVVTDAYHFGGSLFLYTELAKQGLDLHVIRPKDNKISYDDLEKSITPGTRLVAVSLVSAYNGFQHDLKKVCEIAHAKNALVYADIIQAVGAVPIDVKESGVDFCACATYKWLMGDFGAGFLYVRKDKLELLKRTQIGYRQEESFISHVYPFDEPGDIMFESKSKTDTGGHFEVGTLGNGAIAAIRHSLTYILATGVSKIQGYRKPMLDLLQQKMPTLGFTALTAEESTSPIVSFAYKDADRLKSKLDIAGINIQLYQNKIRISPSIYNDMEDINKLIKTLS